MADFYLEYDLSAAMLCQWWSKYGGMNASDIKRLKELQEEYEKLKRIYAKLALETRRI